jgi:hypothetical protein
VSRSYRPEDFEVDDDEREAAEDLAEAEAGGAAGGLVGGLMGEGKADAATKRLQKAEEERQRKLADYQNRQAALNALMSVR